MGLIQYYHITCKPVNQAICIFISEPMVFCNLVSIKKCIVRGLMYSSFFPPPIKPHCQGRVMGFVGGGGNIAITTVLPPSFCVLYCKHKIVHGISLSYFYACLSLRFLDVEINHGPRRPVPVVCRILCSNVRGLAGNLSDLPVA